MDKIVVVGSCNMDMVVKTSQIPKPGNTVIGGEFIMNAGGKGANQAVAAARLGSDEVVFVAKVGKDLFGKQSAQLLEEENINISKLAFDSVHPTGVALITVDKDGENSIVVAPGANGKLIPDEVEQILMSLENIEIILIQLEIPLIVVEAVIRYGRNRNIKIVLNPAPAIDLSPNLLAMIDIITPNTHEAEILSGVKIKDIPSARRAAESIQAHGVKTVIITMGEEGAILLDEDIFYHVPASLVDVIDTTAAGDVFNGALVVAIIEGKRLLDAVSFACQASSIAVTRLGAQSSAPYRSEMILQY